jgi:hypothetical protein
VERTPVKVCLKFELEMYRMWRKREVKGQDIDEEG